jgi:hypothetical protein
MIAIGVFIPFLIAAFRHSVLDGAALTYVFALPTLLGACELESYVNAQPEQSASRRLRASVRNPVIYFTLSVALILLWALCVAKFAYPWFIS